MAEQKSSKRPESLEARAQQILAKRAGDRKLTVAAIGESVLPSSGKTLSCFEAFPEGRHNDEHFRVVLDENGAEVDLAKLSASDRTAVFDRPPSPTDRTETRASLSERT